MNEELFREFKTRQRAMWATFAPTAVFTTPAAARLVRFAGIAPGERVLDVATGTGVVAITAARAGAKVSALDLSPVLIEEARKNGQIAGCSDIAWTEGDAEQLPYGDASFDVVLSQFGHIFAPRPDIAVREMRRVLRPGGRVAFATWPPEHLVGRMFALMAQHAPPPPGGAAPAQWGNPAVITERLAPYFGTPFFERGTLSFPALSLAHYREFLERTIGPLQKLIETLANDPTTLAALRAQLETLARPYYVDNEIRQDYLMTRASVASG